VIQKIQCLALICCFQLAMAGEVWADTVGNLYDETLIVESQSQETRNLAASEALQRVFVRVSGRSDAAENTNIRGSLVKPDVFITQYRYQRKVSGEGEDIIELSLSFSSRLVNEALQNSGLPVWSANRPAVLLWLLADTAEGRRFVGAGADSGLLADLDQAVKRRGIALQMPLFDLADSTNLSADELWRMSVDDVRSASSRYSAPFVLMGRASQLSTGEWVASWVILQENEMLRLESDGKDGEALLRAPINTLADLQAAKYSVLARQVGNEESDTLIHISGVADFVAYANLVTYLEGLAVIQHANTVWLSGEDLILELVLNDDMNKVKRFLSLDGRLQEVAAVSGSQALARPVSSFYHWTGHTL
jgi:hypothetical protein